MFPLTVTQLQLQAVVSNLTLAGNLDLTNNNKITGLGVPSADTDAATKVYVDEPNWWRRQFSPMDATGPNDTQIGLVLNDPVPDHVAANGTIARIILQLLLVQQLVILI